MDLIYTTLGELKIKLDTNAITAEEIVQYYLDRIKKYDSTIQSYVAVNENALDEARAWDKKRKDGEDVPPYAGIPIALKDNMIVKGLQTACSSKILEGFKAPYDGTLSTILKENGFVVLGKLNMDEFAMGSSCETSFYQKTTNPWNKEFVPGGSSGGSAAAMAARLAPLTLGSDTGGSIRQPASFCGVTGLKPTYGRISRYGLVAFASSLDQIGPITWNAEDAAEILSVIGQYDEKDSTSAKVESKDYKKALTGDIKGLRIGIPEEYFSEGLDEEVKKSVKAAIDQLKELGAEIKTVQLPHTDYSVAVYYILATAEASSNLARFDGVRYGHRAEESDKLNDLYVKSRSEGFGTEVKRRIMLGTYVLSAGYYDAYYLKAQRVRTLIKNDFINAFKEVDVIVGPTAPTTAFKLGEKMDDPLQMYLNDIYTISLNLFGGCGMSIPCGFDSAGMPIGLQLLGNHFEEDKLLNTAYTYQQNTEWHKKVPTLS